METTMITDPLTDDPFAAEPAPGLCDLVLDFLVGLENHDGARARMASAGYTPDDHEEGWNLLMLAPATEAPEHRTPYLAELARWHRRWCAVANERLAARYRLALGMTGAPASHRANPRAA
jgi:hypothetical protein